MSNVAIDTLEYTQLLRNAGVKSEQAEAMAQALGKALTVNLATKDDLALTAAALKSDILELNVKIEALRTDLLRWMVGTQIAFAGLIIAAIKLL